MNSGCGTNDGIFKVKFDDGMEICYITPGGEVSGLTYGDRKFNIVGKGTCYIIQVIIGLKAKIFLFSLHLTLRKKVSFL